MPAMTKNGEQHGEHGEPAQAAAPATRLEVLRPLGKMWDDQRPTVQIRSDLAPIAVKRRWA